MDFGTSLSSMPEIEEATWIVLSFFTFLLSLALKNHKWILEELMIHDTVIYTHTYIYITVYKIIM